MEAPQVSELVTVGGAGLLVAVIMEVIVRAWQPDSATIDRFGPLIAIALGIVVVEIAGILTGLFAPADIAQGLVTGLFAGLTAIGWHDVASGVGKAATNT